jgi:demethylmenaquinone methyltransferase/2-methoxy-6-polyprenyl-1,4-benzoquinol methylase
MSSFAWMRFLESAPERYDAGIRMLSGGRIEDVYERIAARVAAPERRVLDVGCGTGGVSLACAARGARVVGIDPNAGMLEVARRKLAPAAGSVEWLELGAAEIEDRFDEASFDAVVSCLVFSELSDDEQRYTLAVVKTRLVPGGEVVIADEAEPRSRAARVRHRLRRAPRSALTWLLTQTSTRPVRDLRAALERAGFADVGETRLWADTFAIAHGARPKAAG